MSHAEEDNQEHGLLGKLGLRDFALWMAQSEHPIRMSLRRFAAAVDVESVVQETFLRVWSNSPQIRGDGRPHVLLRYALRVARNLAISEARRYRIPVVDIEDLAQAAVEPAPIRDPAVADAVRACRDKLPPQPRAAIRARIESYGVVSDEELAAELEMRPNTFLQNVTRARRLLAECLRLRGIDLALEMR
ncbi:MAG: hypothetical protein RLZZ562_1134 [Planctomycetota bacterium]